MKKGFVNFSKTYGFDFQVVEDRIVKELRKKYSKAIAFD